MSTIEEMIKAMDFERVKKGDELSSQKYEQEMAVSYKKKHY